MHLRSILYSMYRLTENGCGMDKSMVIVENNICKLGTANLYVNWNATRQPHGFNIGLNVRHMTSHHGALEPQKNPSRLVFSRLRSKSMEI